MLHLIDLEIPSNSTHFEIELLELKNDSYWKILFLILRGEKKMIHLSACFSPNSKSGDHFTVPFLMATRFIHAGSECIRPPGPCSPCV